MNHGFAVDAATLPGGVVETHKSLFDGSNCGIAITGKNAFSVQYHPGSQPGAAGQHLSFREVCGWVEVMTRAVPTIISVLLLAGCATGRQIPRRKG